MNEVVARVQGGVPLNGSVNLSGSKHTALAILGALPLLRGSIKMVNLPEIRDIEHMLKINESLGVVTSRTAKNEYVFFAEEINYSKKELWRVSELRSSILYLGSIMLNTGYVLLPLPGGDRLGLRPLNQFLYVLDAFGIPHDLRLDGIKASFNGLEGNRDFDLCSKMFSSTGNNRSALALMLAYANKGTTRMKNVLIVPEIVHLCQFLQVISQGEVVIEGIGTDTVSVMSPGLDAIWQNKCPGPEYMIASDKCEILSGFAPRRLPEEISHVMRQSRKTSPGSWKSWMRDFCKRQGFPLKYWLQISSELIAVAKDIDRKDSTWCRQNMN